MKDKPPPNLKLVHEATGSATKPTSEQIEDALSNSLERSLGEFSSEEQETPQSKPVKATPVLSITPPE